MPNALNRRLPRIYILVAVLGGFALAPIARAQTEDAIASLSRDAWKMASEGNVEGVWREVGKLPADADDPAVKDLRSAVATHEQHIEARRKKTLARFEKKRAEMIEKIEEDDLRKALGAAVEASGLAEDPDVFLAELKVTELVAAAEKSAAEHEKAGHWPKALAYYRALELLFDNQNKYTDSLKRVGRRVMLLRLYAPDVLFELYKAEAKEIGEDEPEPFNLEEDHWQTQLEGITTGMLFESLRLGDQQHVEADSNGGYESLLQGGIDALGVMIETKGLEKTFETLGDPEKVAAMNKFLAELKAELAKRPNPLGGLEAFRVIARIQRQNELTVKLPEAVIIHELGDGALATLDDFSNVIWPHDKARFERTISGKFSGVGIQISLVNRQLTVVTPLSGTPAHKAGIKPGDRITSVNGKSTLGMELETAVDLITGDEGTDVTLGIKTGTDKARDVKLTRKSIKIYSIKGWERKPGGKWDYYIDPENHIGYVRMTSFGPTTAAELDAAINQLRAEKGINGLILDLRFNPGGLLKAAEEVVNRFIDKGLIVSTTQMLPNGQPWALYADNKQTYGTFPVVVLINKGSASASEIVSGALQDHKRALIVGDRSFGKGSVQNLFRIGGGSGFLKLTTQYYKIPSGRIIHRRPGAKEFGISPDVDVRVTDRQVADAIEARTLLDILRDEEGEAVAPEAVLNSRARDGEKDDDEPVEPKPEVKTASDILKHGIDPQLETALLLLKAKLLTVAGK